MNALRVYSQTRQNACSLHSSYKINHFCVVGVWRSHIMGGMKARWSPCGSLHQCDRGQPIVPAACWAIREGGREKTATINYSY